MIDVLPLLDGDKSEEPTERKLRKTYDEGRQPDASPIARPLALLAGVLVLRATLPTAFDSLRTASVEWLDAAASGTVPDCAGIATVLTRFALPLALATAGAGLAVRAALGSRLWSTARLSFDPSRVVSFSATSAWAPLNVGVNAFWSAVKLALVGAVAWWVAPRLGSEADLTLSIDGASRVLAAVGVVWLAAGVAEYLVGRWCFLASLRMTHREVQEDQRLAEGNPKVRQRIREDIEKIMARSGAAAHGNSTGN